MVLVRVLTTTTAHALAACVRNVRELVSGRKVGVDAVVHGSSFIVPGLVTWKDLAPKLAADWRGGCQGVIEPYLSTLRNKSSAMQTYISKPRLRNCIAEFSTCSKLKQLLYPCENDRCLINEMKLK